YSEGNHFGLVYRLPSLSGYFRCESLGNILLNPSYRELLHRDLQNRLKLAKALAWTLFELHSIDWVHESLDPDNILLFGEDVGGVIQFDWSKPYVVGFHSARSVDGFSGRLNIRTQQTVRLYTHPDRQADSYVRFEKKHDI